LSFLIILKSEFPDGFICWLDTFIVLPINEIGCGPSTAGEDHTVNKSKNMTKKKTLEIRTQHQLVTIAFKPLKHLKTSVWNQFSNIYHSKQLLCKLQMLPSALIKPLSRLHAYYIQLVIENKISKKCNKHFKYLLTWKQFPKWLLSETSCFYAPKSTHQCRAQRCAHITSCCLRKRWTFFLQTRVASTK
jgi:hypothetical protein